MVTSSSSIVTSLSAGSGVDIRALAQSLVDTEKAPQAAIIQKRIDQSNAKISGYAAINYALDALKTAFDGLRDVSDFASIGVANSQPSAFGVAASATAGIGTYDIAVDRVATAQRSVIGASTDGNGNAVGFSSSSDSLNGGAAFTLNLSVNGGADQPITVTTDTPAGLVSAINGSDLGVQAQLINTGAEGYKVVVTGQTGVDNAFTLTPAPSLATAAFDANELQAAGDAQFSVNGLSLTRSENTVTDVVDGVTLDLYAATTGSARVDLSRDTMNIKSNLQNLLTAYNDFVDTLGVLGDRDSDLETFGGALAGDSFLVSIRSEVRNLIAGASDTGGDNISAFRDVGVSFDRYGKMTFDEGAFDDAVTNHYDEVVSMLTADTEAQSVYSNAPAGAAGAAYKRLDEMLRSTGLLSQRTQNAEVEVNRYEDRMSDLEDRMDRLLQRYLNQFGIMDAIVGSLNSTRAGLTSTFEGMMANYTK